MSVRCSICQHPLRDSINVSLLRDGTRSTARQCQVSRPALHRHKRHMSQTSVALHAREGVGNRDSAIPLRSRIEGSIQCCGNVLRQGCCPRDNGVPCARRRTRPRRSTSPWRSSTAWMVLLAGIGIPENLRMRRSRILRAPQLMCSRFTCKMKFST
jgi:hypothetical protein